MEIICSWKLSTSATKVALRIRKNNRCALVKLGDPQNEHMRNSAAMCRSYQRCNFLYTRTVCASRPVQCCAYLRACLQLERVPAIYYIMLPQRALRPLQCGIHARACLQLERVPAIYPIMLPQRALRPVQCCAYVRACLQLERVPAIYPIMLP